MTSNCHPSCSTQYSDSPKSPNSAHRDQPRKSDRNNISSSSSSVEEPPIEPLRPYKGCCGKKTGIESSQSQNPQSHHVVAIGPFGPFNEQSSLATTSIVSSNDATIIRELPDGQRASISGALHFCKRRILYPYLKLLGVMGLKPFNAESTESCTFPVLINKMYIFVVAVLLLSGYLLQYLTCFRRDRGFSYKEELSERVGGCGGVASGNWTDCFQPEVSSGNYSSRSRGRGDEVDGDNWGGPPPAPEGPYEGFHTICSGNVFYVHFVPAFLHFASFLYMLYLYWLNHDEQLQNLIERVFIQTTHGNTSFFSHKKVLRRLKVLVLFGALWLSISALSLTVQILYHQININWYSSGTTEQTRKVIGAVMGFSTFWQDAIQVTEIISYCIHCNLLSIYLEFIHSRISQHSISLTECIKEIGEIEKLLRYLNNELATGLLPLIFLDAIFTVGSLTFLLSFGKILKNYDLLIGLTACMMWILLLVLPFIQAARLSSALYQVRELGHLVRLRPFGYQHYQQSDLDSFLLFMSTLTMDVRIFKIPLTTTSLSLLACLITFIVIIWGYFQ